MKDLIIEGDKRMTVQDVAEALRVSDRTVRRHAESMGMTRNGFTTYLSENDVTRIKQAIERSGRNDLDNVVQVRNVRTELEMAEKTLEVMVWMRSKIADQAAELAAAAPKVESFDALMRSERTMSITEAAKHFGLHAKAEVFPYLRERGYLTLRDLPTQDAIDAGYLSLRETKCADGTIRPQAVVEACQLDAWRKRVVPQVKGWKAVTA